VTGGLDVGLTLVLHWRKPPCRIGLRLELTKNAMKRRLPAGGASVAAVAWLQTTAGILHPRSSLPSEQQSNQNVLKNLPLKWQH
jgi:hypothetical protein